MKYASGGITGTLGQALVVEVPIAAKEPAKAGIASGGAAPKNAPAAAEDPPKDVEFVEGIDVSASQNTDSIDWTQVHKSGRRFMYAQMGMTPEALAQKYADEDKAGSQHISKAAEAGLWVGAYQYAYFNHDPIRDADLLLKAVQGLPNHLPVVIEAEAPSQD